MTGLFVFLVPLIFITLNLYKYIIWRYIVMQLILFCFLLFLIANHKNLGTKIIKNETAWHT